MRLFFIRSGNFCNVLASWVSYICGLFAGGSAAEVLAGLVSRRLAFVGSFTILLVVTSSAVLAVNEPAAVTSEYMACHADERLQQFVDSLQEIKAN